MRRGDEDRRKDHPPRLKPARYIADFCAPSVGLVVEVDGGYHQARARADARRDRALAQLGYRVVRVPAALVVHDLGQAIAVVRAALAA